MIHFSLQFYKRVCLFFAFTLVFTIINAQNYTFERINTQDGLSQNNIMSSFKCSDGYLWFTTYDGLNRYDGYEFKVYRNSKENKNSIGANLVFRIDEDNNKNLWISSFNDGISRFNKVTEKFTVFKNTPENPDLLTSNNTPALLCDSKNNIWIGTNKGLTYMEMAGDSISRIIKINTINSQESSAQEIINDIYEDSQGRIFISTMGGVGIAKINKMGELNVDFHQLNDNADPIFRTLEVSEGYLCSYNNKIQLVSQQLNYEI